MQQEKSFRKWSGWVHRGLPIVGGVIGTIAIAVAVHAAAPSTAGSLSGSLTQVRDGETVTLNTLTFQDIRPAELTAANDLRIKIPETINAVFDTSVTTVSLGGTATSTDPQVFYDGNRIVRTNTTSTPAASSTLSIAGLKIVGTGQANAATALQYSIDGGATYGSAAAMIEVIGRSGRDVTPPGSVTGASASVATNGRSVLLRWTNPTDSDFNNVRVYRSNIANTVGTHITTTSAGTYTDTEVAAGMTYYYLIRAVDLSGYEDQGLVQLSVTIPAAGTTPPPTPEPTPAPTPTPEPAPTPAPAPPPSLPAGVMVGDLIRGSTPAVYLVGRDGKRHAYPTERVYRSWYADFSRVKRVSDDVLAAIPLGANVTIRPGTHLVKIVSDPRVYVVEMGGILRWLENETVARDLYGAGWALRVVDVDVALFGSYAMGDSIATAAFPAGSVVRSGTGDLYVIVRDGSRMLARRLEDQSFVQNHFDNQFVLPGTVSLPDTGAGVNSEELPLSLPL